MDRIDVNWQAVKLSLCTGAAGTVVGAYLLVQLFGYLDPLRVRRLVAAANEAAVVASLARKCAEEFRSLPDARKRFLALTIGRDRYRINDVFPAGLVTRPGAKQADQKLVQACEALLLQEQHERELDGR